jgi:integrase
MADFEAGLITQPEVFGTLCEIIDTSLVAGHPLALGTVLAFIKSSNTIACFRAWEHSPEAEALAVLGEAISALPPRYSPPPLADSKAGREHFFGDLGKYYLLALLAERIPSSESDPHKWMFVLRAWLLLHAYMRYREGIRLDENLQTASRAMRLACDTDAIWLQFFLRLYPGSSPKSFRELNFRLAARARQLLSSSELTDRERKALRALNEISSYRNKPPKELGLLPTLIGKLRPHTVPISSEISALDTTGHDATIASNSEHGTTLITETPPEGYTPAERKLSARSVLLSSAESIQLLPWSWHRPNPFETKRLQEGILSTLANAPSASPRALTAALVWAAINLGRSSTRLLAVRIGNTVESEWQFAAEQGHFKRKPPMRLPGWQPDETALNWIEPIAAEITLHLPDPVRLALGQAHRRSPEARTLRELWPSGNLTTPEQAISATLHDISPRLSGAMLAELLPQRVFELQQDATLARLIASHPQAPLSGAHSYAQWRLDTVTSLLSGDYGTRSPDCITQPIALGSRLAVFDHLIRDSIRRSRNAVIMARKSENPIAFHNAYTAYAVVALLAATGARPIRSPFESLAHFDFEAELLYVDDKHGGAQQRSGRVIPLASGISAFIQKRYLPHLRSLANILAKNHSSLSQSIARAATTENSGEIPLFFFLEENGAWAEVSPITLFEHAHLDWPLPANLFRHRLANRLRTLGLDPEIIDGLLGHGEWGSETWSHLSFRNWQSDAASAQPLLDHAFRPLRFYPLRGLPSQGALPAQLDCSATPQLKRPFGAEARHRERRRRYFATLREAEYTIRDFLQNGELAALDADQLDKLADRLTRTKEGMPIPSGGLRLAYLIRKLERIEARSGKRHRPKRERLIVDTPSSMFTEKAPGAKGAVARIKLALGLLFPTAQSAQRLVAIVGLCVEARITDVTLLQDIAAGRGYRLVRLGSAYYLEYGQINCDNDVAGRRFRISNRTAEWLHHSRDARPLKPTDKLPTTLQGLFGNLASMPSTVAAMLTDLAQIVEQANALSFPGVVCGVLAGKIESTALGWRDAVRLHCGRKIDIEAPQEKLETESTLKYRGQFIATGSPALRSEANRQLLKVFPRLLRSAEESPPGTPNVRRTMCMAIEKAIREGIHQHASPALLLLAQWVLYLARSERRSAPRPVSLRRYWAALAWRFHNEIPEFDLLQADEDELTEAYTRVLICHEKRAGRYALERLAHFHRWLARTFDVEDPAWEELPATLPGLGVSPGFIKPQEYLEAFEQLVHTPALGAETPICAAMTLLLAYRFGLRRREALYLTREDWEEQDGHIVVTVRGNRWRRLKSDSSRRQVPLVFSLGPLERVTITRALALYATRHGNDHCHLLFSYSTVDGITSAIRQTLKQVTGNPYITLHHARHSAANLVALDCIGICPEPWNRSDIAPDAATQLLGGNFSPSRRHGWAIARFLGHASPRTTCKSYLHFIFSWAESLLSFAHDDETFLELQGITDLGQLPELPPEPDKTGEVAQPQGTIEAVLKAYRLHARQVSPAAISATLGHPTEEVQNWLALLGSKDSISRVGEIVAGLSETSWDRLIAWSASIIELSISNQTSLPAEALIEMVGEKRQLLAWRPEHFALVRSALENLRIIEAQFKLFGSAQLHAGTQQLALAHGFRISERPIVQNGKAANSPPRRMQVDTVYVGPYREPVASRIALLYRENDTHAIRNQPQFVLVVLILGILQGGAFTSRGAIRNPTHLPSVNTGG